MYQVVSSRVELRPTSSGYLELCAMVEYTSIMATCVCRLVFYVLLDPALGRWETTTLQLAPLVNHIGDGDGVSGAIVTEDMLDHVFKSQNNYIYHTY